MQIVEVFSSIQGEGKYVGCRQVFVRFAGCNLACFYCDTPEAANADDEQLARIEQTAGCRDFRTASNPISEVELVKAINVLLQSPHHSVSFTGGEPLLQAQALAAVAAKLNTKIYLETNGTLPAALEFVLPFVQIISMDIKLPGITGKDLWQKQRDFLHVAAQREVFVKLVLTGQTTNEEFQAAVELVAAEDKDILFLLQPVTPVSSCTAVAPSQLITYQQQALQLLTDVRVIPQTHKFIGQL